jgi:putative salt-induced outer membrane protein YdiY
MTRCADAPLSMGPSGLRALSRRRCASAVSLHASLSASLHHSEWEIDPVPPAEEREEAMQKHFTGAGCWRALRCLFLGVLLSGGAPALIAKTGDWQPPPPMPDEYDWVQLTSGEWLKGEIKAMYRDSLEFDSDKLGLLEFDMEDVKQIRSAQILNVRIIGNRVANGKLLLEDGRITVIGDRPGEFSRADLLSLTAGVPKERNFWSGKISLGGNWSSGNTDQTNLNAMVNAQRRTVKDRVQLRYLGNFSKANDEESVNNHRLDAIWDRFISDRLFVRPVFGEYYRDPFLNIAHRITLGTGIGYQLIDTARTDWMVFAGPAYQYTAFNDVQPGADTDASTPALSAGTDFRIELTDKIDFTYNYRFQITSEAAGRYNHHMIGTLANELVDSLDLEVSLIWDRVASPAPTADGTTPKSNDYQLILGVGYSF